MSESGPTARIASDVPLKLLGKLDKHSDVLGLKRAQTIKTILKQFLDKEYPDVNETK